MSLIQKITFSAIALSIAFNASMSLASNRKVDIDVSKLPSTVLTTIADVRSDKDGAIVYADNDIRLLRIAADSKKMIDEAVLARKNGWEVKLVLKSSLKGDVSITSLQIKSRKNVLTTGFNMPDTKFAPIVAKNAEEAEQLFASVYPYSSDNYDVNDNCFNRAQFWSRMHQVGQKVKGSDKGTDKVFIFFTPEYQRKFDHKWWFHVAPMIYVGGKSNPVVLDPTFMGSAVSLQEWLSAFDHSTDGKCLKVESLDDYYRYGNQPVCLYITASMFTYSPSDLRGTQRLSNWRCSDFERVKQGIPAPGAHTFNRTATWSDRKNQLLIPEMCGGPAITVSTPEPPPLVVPDVVPDTHEEEKPETEVSLTESKWVGRITADAELRAGPGGNYQALGHIRSNTKVNLFLSGNEWLEVIVPAGILGEAPIRGYINKSSIELDR